MPQPTQRETTRAQKPPPLVIYATREFDGYTYQLELDSQERVKHAHPQPRSFPRIFVSQDVDADFASQHGSMVPQLIPLLTGLSEDQVRSLGGVTFQDPKTERELLHWPPEPS